MPFGRLFLRQDKGYKLASEQEESCLPSLLLDGNCGSRERGENEWKKWAKMAREKEQLSLAIGRTAKTKRRESGRRRLSANHDNFPLKIGLKFNTKGGPQRDLLSPLSLHCSCAPLGSLRTTVSVCVSVNSFNYLQKNPDIQIASKI